MSSQTSPSAVSLPAGVRQESLHRSDVVLVDTGAARATLHLDGAHLTSWTPTGESDLLWISPTSGYGAGTAIRGGIPLIGPWFGPGRDRATTPNHGWLRTNRWELTAARTEGENRVLELELNGADPADTGVRAAARFTIGAELDVELTISAGEEPLELEAALHTYLAVKDVRQAGIDGLQDVTFLDNRRDLIEDRQEEGILVLAGATDRIYDHGTEVLLHDELGRRKIRALPRGTAKTVVWNPWDELVGGMDDIPDETWPQFVCIEPAVAKDRFVTLAAGDSHTIGVTYRIEH